MGRFGDVVRWDAPYGGWGGGMMGGAILLLLRNTDDSPNEPGRICGAFCGESSVLPATRL